MRPKIIEFEGSDGSGKHTQCKLLSNFLQNKYYKSIIISFPTYGEDTKYLTKYINGDYNSINIYARMMFYIVDRYVTFLQDYNDGKYDEYDYIILDRYIFSNIICNVPSNTYYNISNKNNEEYSFHNISRWALDTELQKCDLPKPDIVIVYKLNVDKVIELLHNEAKELDHLEKSNEYLKLQYNNILSLEKDIELCDEYKIHFIDCMNGQDLKNIYDVHLETVSIFTNNIVQ